MRSVQLMRHIEDPAKANGLIKNIFSNSVRNFLS